MACETPSVRERLLAQYLEEYEQHNPHVDGKELVAIRNDMEKLIESKLRLFPAVHRQIGSAQMTRTGGEDRVDVVSIRAE